MNLTERATQKPCSICTVDFSTRDVQLSIRPHPPTPSPALGEGEQEWLKVPLPLWERDLG